MSFHLFHHCFVPRLENQLPRWLCQRGINSSCAHYSHIYGIVKDNNRRCTFRRIFLRQITQRLSFRPFHLSSVPHSSKGTKWAYQHCLNAENESSPTYTKDAPRPEVEIQPQRRYSWLQPPVILHSPKKGVWWQIKHSRLHPGRSPRQKTKCQRQTNAYLRIDTLSTSWGGLRSDRKQLVNRNT